MGNISYFKNCCPQDQEESRLEDGETAKEMTASFAKMYNENVLPKSESSSREKNLMESLYFLKDSVLIGKGSGNPVDKYKIQINSVKFYGRRIGRTLFWVITQIRELSYVI